MQVLGGAAVAALIVFLGALRATLRAREGEAGALSATAVIAGSVLGGAGLVALAEDEPGLSELLAFPAATLLVAASVGVLQTGALPRWIAYAGFAAAALQVTAAFGLPELALGAVAAWAVLASVAMLTQRGD